DPFAGCIAGIHEVLRRQGLMQGTWCLDPHEQLSPGQSEEIDRVIRCYPDLTDDDFVAAHLDRWLSVDWGQSRISQTDQLRLPRLPTRTLELLPPRGSRGDGGVERRRIGPDGAS